MPADQRAGTRPDEMADTPDPRYRAYDAESFSPEARAVADAILAGPRAGLSGPFVPWLESPELAALAQQLGRFTRYDTVLPTRLSELAILYTGQHWSAQFEWHHHAPIAREAGVPQSVLDAMQRGERPVFAADDEQAVYDFCDEVYRLRRVRDVTFARAHNILGQRGVVELVGILGYYALVSMTLNVFAVPIPEDATAPFPEPETP